jgi:CheY-like chemotaxis protein
MKVLFVEDDDDKAGKVAEEVLRAIDGVTLVRARSFDSALRNLVLAGSEIDGMLLDMSMPNFDDSQEPPESFAGRDLLRQCKLRGIAKPTIVITQLDSFGVPPDQLSLEQLNVQLLNEFSPSYYGVVYYSSAHESWKSEIVRLIEKMMEQHASSCR